MKIQAVNNNSNGTSFGIVKYNKEGLERLNKKLGLNAQDFIKSQEYNNFADILLMGDEVSILYKNKSYKIQDYRKAKYDELILEDDSHFYVNDGKYSFDIFPTNYSMYLEHLFEKLITVPFKLGNKKGLFVTNTQENCSINYGQNNLEYANAQEMASHLNKFELAHINTEERMLIEDNSWAEAYEKLKQNIEL